MLPVATTRWPCDLSQYLTSKSHQLSLLTTLHPLLDYQTPPMTTTPLSFSPTLAGKQNAYLFYYQWNPNLPAAGVNAIYEKKNILKIWY